MVHDLEWLAVRRWNHIEVTYWPADEENAAKWFATAERTQEVDGAGWNVRLWQYADTPDAAIAKLRKRAELLGVI